MCGTGLSGKTVGIVGLGRIGLRVAELLKNFNTAKMLYTSRAIKPEASKFGGEKVEFDILLKNSDFVIVTVALTPETKHMFNTEAFKQMKETAIFVNGSRGDIVDQEALINALKNGTIAAAGLDVVTPEPIPLDHELLKLDNCGRYIDIDLGHTHIDKLCAPEIIYIYIYFYFHFFPFSGSTSYRKCYHRD